MNIIKKRLNLVLITLALLTCMAEAFAADPGHIASSISTGQFESGNYTFPDSLNTTSLLEAGKTLFAESRIKAGGNL